MSTTEIAPQKTWIFQDIILLLVVLVLVAFVLTKVYFKYKVSFWRKFTGQLLKDKEQTEALSKSDYVGLE